MILMKRPSSISKSAIALFIIVAATQLSWGQLLRISGTLACASSGSALPFATVALHSLPDSALITGTTTSAQGNFTLSGQWRRGRYLLKVSYVGYNPFLKEVYVDADLDMGSILLAQSSFALDELVISGERVKAKVSGSKTTYNIGSATLQSSLNGVDVLRSIPSVHIDFMQNVTLEGGKNLVLLVDGKERDISYLRQIDAKQLERVEVQALPDSRYGSENGGVISVVLKDRQTGFAGNVYGELPTASTEVYLFPSYSFSYGSRRLALHTSYNGELTRMRITEVKHRESEGYAQHHLQRVMQRGWSHRFGYGADYFLNRRTTLSYYGYIRRFSQEHDGTAEVNIQSASSGSTTWLASKDDTDINTLAFNSIYYKQLVSDKGELTAHLSHYYLNAQSSTEFISSSTTGNVISTQKPLQNSLSLKVDYTHTMQRGLLLSAGAKLMYRGMEDRLLLHFMHTEGSIAAYSQADYSTSTLTASAGLRYEHYLLSPSNHKASQSNHLMPSATISYKLAPKHTISLAYRQWVVAPTVYQLSPAAYSPDLNTTQTGNPQLGNESHFKLTAGYSVQMGKSLVTAQLFALATQNAIGYLYSVDANSKLMGQANNLGAIERLGAQLTGALRITKSISVSPFVKVYSAVVAPNSLATSRGVGTQSVMVLESGLSATAALGRSMALSVAFQYNTPQPTVQTETYSDALYFISLTKTFRQRYMLGITTAIPFTKSFTYFGANTLGNGFRSHSEGVIAMSAIPLWLKFSYSFSSGKKVSQLNRENEPFDALPRKGF